MTRPGRQRTWQEGEKYGLEVFDIDIGRCMFCGLCVEACPYDALHMGSGFEEGRYVRAELVIDIDRLGGAEAAEHWFRPSARGQGDTTPPLRKEEHPGATSGRHERPTT